VVLPLSTEATIKSATWSAAVHRARAGRRPARSAAWSAGERIPLAQTHPAVNLTQLFNGFRTLFQALSPPMWNQLSLS